MMNKQEFLNALSDRLQGIPIDDREKSLEYYSEMIQKKIECIGNHFDCSRLSDMVSHSNFIDCGNIYIISGIVGTDTLHLYRSIFVCGVGHSNYYCTCYEHS